MANTVIQLKHSTLTGNVPSSLANGEISINSRDGKFFYSTPAGVVVTHYPYPGPAGLNGEIQFNDSGVLGTNSGLTFSKTTGYFTAPIIASSNNGNGTNFKVGDDIWIGDVNIADTLRLTGQQNVNNAYIIFGASDTKKLGRSGTGALTYDGGFTANGEISSLQSSGDEGGQINLAVAATNTSLNGSVAIDIYQNKIRIFETGGTNRGVYIDMANGAATGVGTDLLSPSSSTDGWARGQANAAFIQANTPSHVANSAASYANSAFLTANNSAGVNLTQNSNITSASSYANSAFLTANTPSHVANSAALYANNAYNQANTANTRAFNSVLKTGDTMTGALNISNSTASTNTTTGALIVLGGVGISGALNATTKSFNIKHPTKKGKNLTYGSLEGPEFGVYVRGRTKENVIELPDYWVKLIDANTITVQLTPIGNYQTLFVEKIENNKVYIKNSNLMNRSIDCFYIVFAERDDVDKLKVEN